jgi:hypothetical protein
VELGSVIVRPFNLECVTILPDEADAELVVDGNCMLTGALLSERVQLVARWQSQVIKPCGPVKHAQLPARYGDEIGRKPFWVLSVKDLFRPSVPEATDQAHSRRWCRRIAR